MKSEPIQPKDIQPNSTLLYPPGFLNVWNHKRSAAFLGWNLFDASRQRKNGFKYKVAINLFVLFKVRNPAWAIFAINTKY